MRVHQICLEDVLRPSVAYRRLVNIKPWRPMRRQHQCLTRGMPGNRVSTTKCLSPRTFKSGVPTQIYGCSPSHIRLADPARTAAAETLIADCEYDA